ncbi:unnamed protein product [Meganyctiphanes norvegica]|uniref:AB hydrolase-1 domain-containing protein n=1 Tax=Meganyctiphanes norvegica TaxID=48144 RepID=A0AAV2S5S8_MEGNR
MGLAKFYFIRLVVLPLLILKIHVLVWIKTLLFLLTKAFVKGRNQLVVRTPESEFEGLDVVGYNFKPHYVDLPLGGGKALPRVHYVDEGPEDACETILCLHGEPSWSFLYRHMIPPLVKAGYRVIAPDFIGFGKSDKYTYMECYSHQLHTQTLCLLIDHLKLRNVTLVCQDWGGLTGLPVVRDMSEVFSRLVIMNTGLPDGQKPLPTPANIASCTPFLLWRAFAELFGVWLPIHLIFNYSLQKANHGVLLGYTAPFPSGLYKAGAAAWPLMVPTFSVGFVGTDLKQTQDFLAKQWHKPALIMFSDKDPITQMWPSKFEKLLPNASKKTVVGAGHFLQEDKGEEIANHVIAFVNGKI